MGPLLLITAENRTENEFGRLAGGSFPMLIGELRARSPTNALQRTLFNDAPWRMVLSDGSHVQHPNQIAHRHHTDAVCMVGRTQMVLERCVFLSGQAWGFTISWVGLGGL